MQFCCGLFERSDLGLCLGLGALLCLPSSVFNAMRMDELESADLVTLADKGYQGSTYAKIPYKGKNKPQSQKDANKAHAQLRSPGGRANAQLKAGSRPGGSFASSVATPGAPDNSPRPSTPGGWLAGRAFQPGG
jgi:hypothetical protein